MYSKRFVFWLIQLAYWSIFFIYNAEIVFGYTNINSALRPLVLSYAFITSYAGVGFSLLLKIIYDRIYTKQKNLMKTLMMLIPAALVIDHIWFGGILLTDQVYKYLFEQRLYPVDFRYYIWEIFTQGAALFIWLLLYAFMNSSYEINRQKEKTEQANLLAKSSQLQALKFQLNPHFLFNSLSSLRALVRSNPELAEEMISRLSEFLRYSLTNREETVVPLEEEIRNIEAFLDIEKVRYGNKIECKIIIDPLSEDFPIPIFLILPLVENSIKYGMLSTELPLKINIRTEVNGDTLLIIIENSGNWVTGDQKIVKERTGTGLYNIKQRLAMSYPDNHSFNIYKSNGSVKIEIQIEQKPELLPNE